MATLRQIQRRIRSVQTTAKTTRAMSLVAGSKMRRAQQVALAHRPYADALQAVLWDVVLGLQAEAQNASEDALHPLLRQREVRAPGVLFITPDRGLCGGLNTNLLRVGGSFVTSHPGVRMISVGRKGYEFFRRTQVEILGTFS